jgi:hypothetical protein
MDMLGMRAGASVLEGESKIWAAHVAALALQAAVLLPAQALPAWLRRLIWQLPDDLAEGASSVAAPGPDPLEEGACALALLCL